MTIFDYVVLVIIGLSIIVSMMRGLLAEILSIMGWFVAFFVARTYSGQLAPMMPDELPTESLRVLARLLCYSWPHF
jgi:membrane protein required for colicin V production